MDGLNPDILRWARETAGLSLEEAAQRLDIGEARGVPGPERLAALEGGAGDGPSRPLLLRMAKQYRRPLLTFYLPSPPAQPSRGEDFRTLPPEHSRTDDAMVDVLLRDVRVRQETVRDVLLDDDEPPHLNFVASMSLQDGADAVLASICARLDITVRAYRETGNGAAGFSYLRERAEAAGVFVVLLGNLGSHHTNIDVNLFRGFALADPVAPFIVINDQDAEVAWSFTLMHELCHLWLGATGVSNARPGSPVEVFCNDVAARFFITGDDGPILQQFRGVGEEGLVALIGKVAAALRVSRSMVAYKLLREGYIDRDVWSRVTAIFRTQWLGARQAQRDSSRDKPGGPSYYVVRRHRLGPSLIALARRAVQSGALTPTKAASVLGVKPSNVHAMLELAPPPSKAS